MPRLLFNTRCKKQTAPWLQLVTSILVLRSYNTVLYPNGYYLRAFVDYCLSLINTILPW
jgi:hypothetical protein